MDSPSFKSFHAQLDCKFKYGNKNQTQLTPGTTVKIHTYYDGVRATAIMLRSNATNSSWRSSVIAETLKS